MIEYSDVWTAGRMAGVYLSERESGLEIEGGWGAVEVRQDAYYAYDFFADTETRFSKWTELVPWMRALKSSAAARDEPSQGV